MQIIIIYLYQEQNRKSPKCASFQRMDEFWRLRVRSGRLEGLRVQKRPPYCGPVQKILNDDVERFEHIAQAKTKARLFLRPAAETSGSAAESLSQTSSRLFSPSLPQKVWKQLGKKINLK